MSEHSGHAIYFEEFTQRMPANFAHDQHVCVPAVTGAMTRGCCQEFGERTRAESRASSDPPACAIKIGR